MIPVPPSGLSEATAEHAAATSRRSPRLINGYFIESQIGYSHRYRHQILLNVEIIRLSAEAVQNIIPPMTSIRHLKRRTPYVVEVTPKMSHSL